MSRVLSSFAAIGALIAVSFPATIASAAPKMDQTQRTTGPELSFQSCQAKAPHALEAVGMEVSNSQSRVWWGVSGSVRAIIICYHLGNGGSIQTFVTATDDQSFNITSFLQRLLQSFYGATARSNPTVRLTPASSTASGSGTIVAPGEGKQNYSVILIDATDFLSGGTIEIDIKVGGGATGGSFDLFSSGAAIPKTGVPSNSLAHAWNIDPGGSAQIRLPFSKGEVFQFGATGDWRSPAGARNTFRFTVKVTP